MAELLYEIWRDGDGCGCCASAVSADTDAIRRAIDPEAVLAGSFSARSDFDVMRKMHDLLGWEVWAPGADRVEQWFSEAEAEEQHQYLAARICS